MKRLIRPARTGDFPTLVAIDQYCFEEGVAYDAFELGYFMSRPSATTLVAEVDGTIAGFILFVIEDSHSGAIMVTLDVTDIYRRAGIASDLLAHSEHLLVTAGTTRYQLQVDTTNSVAIEFYRRRGFSVIRTLGHYYANGADAYLMEKPVAVVTPLQ